MNAGKVTCRYFKLMTENCDLNIEFSIHECLKHSIDKIIIFLNYDEGISI